MLSRSLSRHARYEKAKLRSNSNQVALLCGTYLHMYPMWLHPPMRPDYVSTFHTDTPIQIDMILDNGPRRIGS